MTTTTATPAHTFTADQAVLITLDARRAPRPGFYVEDADNGKVTVRYEVRGKGETFADVAVEKVVAAEPADEPEVDAPAVDDAPAFDFPRSPENTRAAFPHITPDAPVVVYTSWSREQSPRVEHQRGTVSRISRNGFVTVRCPKGTTCDYDPRDLALIVDDAPATDFAAIDWDDTTGVEIGPDHADLIEAQDAEAVDGWDEGPLRPEVARDEQVPAEASAPTEHTAEVREAAAAARPAKARTPKRAPLPEGYVTPVGLAKIINERGLYHGTREGGLSSQIVYAMIKSTEASDHPFPGERIEGRFAVKVEAGVAWWVAKDERAATRRTPAKVDRHDLAAELRAALALGGATDALDAVRAIADRLAA